MTEYTKINTIFERDMEGSKKLIEGKFRDEAVEYLKDNTWVFTEKIDGTNIGVVWDGHTITFQGRTEKAQIPAKLVNRLKELFDSNEVEELFEQKFGETNVILFGEGFGAGIQRGGNYLPDCVDFILFDVYLPNKNLWLKRDAIEEIAKAFNIRVVPIILEGTIDEAVAYVKEKHQSTIGTAPMEGLVGKPKVDMLSRMGDRLIVKIKVCDFT